MGLVIIIAAIASTGGLLFGFDTGVIAGAIPFLEESWGLTTGSIELVTTAVLVGAVIGAFAAGRVTDIVGRKKVILFTSLIFALGSILTGLAPNVWFLIVSRVFLGLAIGISSFTVPLYISEISPSKYRGALVSSFQLMITIGIVASFLSDLAFADESNPFSWRWMFYVGVIPAIVLFIGMIFLPETPRFLISKGRIDEGKKVLSKIESPENYETAYKEIQYEIDKDKKAASYSEIFKKTWRYPLIIAVGIMFIQQFVGINTVIYYAPKLFLLSGFDGPRIAIIATVLVGIVNVASTVLSMTLIDKLGRKKLYFIGLFGMFATLTALGIFFLMKDNLGDNLSYVTVGTVLVYIIFFAISLGPLGWLIISEVFPLKIRGVGMSIGSLSNWAFNAVVAFTFLKMAGVLTSDGSEVILDNPQSAYKVSEISIETAQNVNAPNAFINLLESVEGKTFDNKIELSAALEKKQDIAEYKKYLDTVFAVSEVNGVVKLSDKMLDGLENEIPDNVLLKLTEKKEEIFLSKQEFENFISTILPAENKEELKKTVQLYVYNNVEPNPAGSFFVFAVIALLGIVLGIKFFPETKGISLEKIEEHWRQGKKPNELK
jgi:MFS transporter, SP family, galactose:H+ symporter